MLKGTFATKRTLNLICGLFMTAATQKLVSGSRPESLLMSFSPGGVTKSPLG